MTGNMTLHALHYAIMKAFGWQNSHLHSFVPTKEEFDRMTDGGKVSEWYRQVGMYFRFPSEDFEDLYWDDDYEEGMNMKSWLKSKYCGPYIYGGIGEYYLPLQKEVEDFHAHYPEIRNKSTDQRDWHLFMGGQCEELLERLPLFTVLRNPADKMDWKKWREEKEDSLGLIEQDRETALQKCETLLKKAEKIAIKVDKLHSKKREPEPEKVLPYIEQMTEVGEELDDLIAEHIPEPIPALSSLLYRYDYGDDWEVKITCTNAWYNRCTYARDKDGNIKSDRYGFVPEKVCYEDAFAREITGDFLQKILEIGRKEKPLCTGWDGINLLDDVGGIYGFCEFLEVLLGDDPEEKKACRAWAKSLGWTGRMPKTENIL